MSASTARPRVLVALPPTFAADPLLAPEFARLRELADPVDHPAQSPDLYLGGPEPRLLDDALDAMPRLKLAALLDCSAPAARVALRRGLSVSLARDAHAPFSAELALQLLLRHFHATPTPLARRPVGLVGFGPVARHLVQLLSPLLVPVSVYDPFVSDELLAACRVIRLDLPELCARNDAVVFTDAGIGMAHAPPLLGDAELCALRPGTALICLSRPALIDTAALHRRLDRAALAVTVVGNLAPHPQITTLPTPSSSDTRRLALRQLLADLEAHLAGRPRAHPLHEGLINLLPL